MPTGHHLASEVFEERSKRKSHGATFISRLPHLLTWQLFSESLKPASHRELLFQNSDPIRGGDKRKAKSKTKSCSFHTYRASGEDDDGIKYLNDGLSYVCLSRDELSKDLRSLRLSPSNSSQHTYINLFCRPLRVLVPIPPFLIFKLLYRSSGEDDDGIKYLNDGLSYHRNTLKVLSF